ncbi:MAG: hypothetical protein MJ071_06805 [Oscillospiraceae bacterium]|nr:hypothetical protein [Oscillospiraceae bacterium]
MHPGASRTHDFPDDQGQKRKKGLADGKISKAGYTEWKLNRPQTTDDCGKHEPAKEWRNL